MRGLLLAAMATAGAAAHAHVHSPAHIDIACLSGNSLPGIALVPFVLLAALGAVRAVLRHRKDR